MCGLMRRSKRRARTHLFREYRVYKRRLVVCGIWTISQRCRVADRAFSAVARCGRMLVTGHMALLCLAGLGFVDAGTIAQEAMDLTVLTVEQEKAKAAKPGSDFKECANGCPVMIVIPAGKFLMGSPENEPDHNASEGPQHEVTIAKLFAVSKFEVTFEEWDACVAAAAPASYRRLGTWKDACDQRELGRRQAVCRLALGVDWQGIPAPDRGRMGIRGEGRRPYPLFLGRQSWDGQCQLRWLWQSMGSQTNGARWII